MKKDVLLLKAGETAPAVRLAAGDYDRWFELAFAQVDVRCQLHKVQAHLGEKLPDASGFDAVVMTGSSSSATEPTPWMRRAADCLREAAERGVPVLGVCFGHQLLGFAYGAQVVRNVKGREIGTVEVSLTAEGRKDPLMAGLGDPFWVQATHEDIVLEPPPGARVLASNESTAIQAMAIGPHVRGVQFHPELSAPGMQTLIEARAAQLSAQGRDVQALAAGVRGTNAGTTILGNFLRHFC